MFQRLMDEVVTTVYKRGWTAIWKAFVHDRIIMMTLKVPVPPALAQPDDQSTHEGGTAPAIPVMAMSSLSVASPAASTDEGEPTATLEASNAASPTSDGHSSGFARRDRLRSLGSTGSDATQLPPGWCRGVRHASSAAHVDPFGSPAAASTAGATADDATSARTDMTTAGAVMCEANADVLVDDLLLHEANGSPEATSQASCQASSSSLGSLSSEAPLCLEAM